MALGNDPLYAEAIMFFDDENIVKEMLFTEFEAVLDGVVGIPEFSNQPYKAAYVTIWRNLSVHIVVLFELTFDKHGHVEKKWNLPLRYLGAQAISGPDLGQGKILLLMQDDCEEEEYCPFLWNAEGNQIEILTAIRDSVKRNKLGLYVENDKSRYSGYGGKNRNPMAEMAFGDTQFDEDYQHRLITNIESTLKFKYEHQIKELEKQHQDIVKQLESHNSRLQTRVEEFDQQTRKSEQANKEHLDIIVDKYQKKLDEKVNKVREELLDKIENKELELSYSKEQLKELSEEFAQLQGEFKPACKNAVHQNLTGLINSGVELIVTQNGIGSYSLKLEQIQDYIANPVSFWAKQCGVNEDSFLAWNQHYQNPVCRAGQNAGCPCNEDLKRIASPKDFEEGQSDMCRKHRLGQLSSAYK